MITIIISTLVHPYMVISSMILPFYFLWFRASLCVIPPSILDNSELVDNYVSGVML